MKLLPSFAALLLLFFSTTPFAYSNDLENAEEVARPDDGTLLEVVPPVWVASSSRYHSRSLLDQCSIDFLTSPLEDLFQNLRQGLSPLVDPLGKVETILNNPALQKFVGPQLIDAAKMIVGVFVNNIQQFRNCVPSLDLDDLLNITPEPMKVGADGIYEVVAEFRKVTFYQIFEMNLRFVLRAAKALDNLLEKLCEPIPDEFSVGGFSLNDFCDTPITALKFTIETFEFPIEFIADRIKSKIFFDNDKYNVAVFTQMKNATARNTLLLFEDSLPCSNEPTTPEVIEPDTDETCIAFDIAADLKRILDNFRERIVGADSSLDRFVSDIDSKNSQSMGGDPKFNNLRPFFDTLVGGFKESKDTLLDCLDAITIEILNISPPDNVQDANNAYRVVAEKRDVTLLQQTGFLIDALLFAFRKTEEYGNMLCDLLPGVSEDICNGLKLGASLSVDGIEFVLGELKALAEYKVFIDETKHNSLVDYNLEEATYYNVIEYLRQHKKSRNCDTGKGGRGRRMRKR